jgi:hypothetical protein
MNDTFINKKGFFSFIDKVNIYLKLLKSKGFRKKNNKISTKKESKQHRR